MNACTYVPETETTFAGPLARFQWYGRGWAEVLAPVVVEVGGCELILRADCLVWVEGWGR